MAKKPSKKASSAPISEEQLLFAEFDAAMEAASNKILKELAATPLTFEPKSGSDNAISTDSLSLDLIMGGGVPRQRMTVFVGASYTGKTTIIQRVMKNALFQNINSHYLDQEGAADPTWMLRNGLDFTKYMAMKGTARKLTAAMDIASGDDAFRYMSRVCEAFATIMSKNPEMYQKLMARGQISLALFLDSLTACIPQGLVEDDEKAAMAAQARMFSQMIPLVRTKLKAANASFITVNQLRTKPGVMMGDPDYEPGGKAPEFYSDLRVRFKEISKPKHPYLERAEHYLFNSEKVKAGGLHHEDNPNGSKDVYKYVHLFTKKNRVFSPFQTTFMRLWVEEDGGPGRGVDPVFDTIQFYEMLGLLEFEGKNALNLEGKVYTYQDLKQEILKNPDLRSRGLEMLKNGMAFAHYFDARSSGQVEELVAPDVELEQETDEAFKAVTTSVKELEQEAGM